MASTNQIIGLVIAVTIGAVFLAPVADIVSTNSGTQTVTEDTVTQSLDYNSSYELDGYNIASDSETIERYDSSTSSWETLTAGSDYELDDSSATIEFNDTTATDTGDEIRASYDWRATDETTGGIVQLIPLLMALLLLVPIANKVKDGV